MLPLKAGSLTQSSPPVRSLEGMQDRDHIWPPFHSDWYLECILCFFLFPSPTVLRHPNLLLGLSMALHGYPSISTQAAGVWPGICQIHGSQRGNETVFDVRVGASRPKRSEKCLVDSILSILNSSPIISFVVTFGVALPGPILRALSFWLRLLLYTAISLVSSRGFIWIYSWGDSGKRYDWAMKKTWCSRLY